jgi:hypothetical protein
MIVSKKLDYSKNFSLVLVQVVRLGSARIKVSPNVFGLGEEAETKS